MNRTDATTASEKSAGILASALALPVAILRRVMRIPTALVDMMEKHGLEK
jgi:hypothetical protein